jgi:hypothetical protein
VGATVLDPISPELVLVCPELRERALAALPEVEWQSTVTQVRVQAQATPAEPRIFAVTVRETALDLVHLLGFCVAALVSILVLTLALTLIANATR